LTFNNFINSIANIGVKKNYQPWEIFLTRKLNLASLLGIVNVGLGLFIFLLFGYYNSVTECVVVLILSPLVFLLNRRFGYLPAAYLFTFIGSFLFFFLAVKMGPDSYAFLYFIPLIIGLLQMLGRKETRFHLLILCVFCLSSILGIVLCYVNYVFEIELSNELILTARYFNIFFSFFTAIGFIFIIAVESFRQEEQLKSALKQKEILLAELFHRVKNNLNIVTSILNLKKNSVSSVEAQNALEECRSIVFSMALVHTRIYNSNNIDSLDFKEYLDILVLELINSFGGKDNVELELNSPPINLNLTQAIPCGLIINEFITNSFKHAQVNGRKLKITVMLNAQKGMVNIELKDNGPGNMTTQQEKNSLGLGLIKSLTDQIDGECCFRNNDGLQFNLKFKK
jgi:two-component sensor histidine kinase